MGHPLPAVRMMFVLRALEPTLLFLRQCLQSVSTRDPDTPASLLQQGGKRCSFSAAFHPLQQSQKEEVGLSSLESGTVSVRVEQTDLEVTQQAVAILLPDIVP